jgi:2-polyprenyl-6-methoxyphenol hydroxylase-like FAD-dependent oxidoreductase
MEIYRQLGVVDTIIAHGKQAQGLQFNHNGKPLAKLPVSKLGEGKTLFPYVFVYEQSKNERVLLDYLTQNCCPVYWDTTLKSMIQSANGLSVVLTDTDNTDHVLTADWLIGADGGHSVVRKQLGISFTGDTYPHLFFLADVNLQKQPTEYINMHLSQSGFVGYFPMNGDDNYRVIGNLPPNLTEKADLSLDDVLPWMDSITKSKTVVQKCNWFTTYRLHHRVADEFRQNRCFLIGDAAHIHSPVGGQGMNTGLQDAYNLAWKLAAVINKQISEGVLHTYAEERIPIAKQLVKTTDRAFNLMMSDGFFAGLIKKYVMARALKFMWGNTRLRGGFFRMVSQTGIHYHESKLSLHLSSATKVIAGDRLPYLKVYDEKKQTETDLHEWCSKPGFTFIAMGQQSEDELFRLARWITMSYPTLLNFFYLPPTNKNRHVFDTFEITASQHKTLIVRPDMYIGFINDSIDVAKIDNYLNGVVGCVRAN